MGFTLTYECSTHNIDKLSDAFLVLPHPSLRNQINKRRLSSSYLQTDNSISNLVQWNQIWIVIRKILIDLATDGIMFGAKLMEKSVITIKISFDLTTFQIEFSV